MQPITEKFNLKHFIMTKEQLLNDFSKWLKAHGYKSAKDYKSYVNTFQFGINGVNYLDLIVNFLNEGDELYAKTVVKFAVSQPQLSSYQYSGLSRFNDFLKDSFNSFLKPVSEAPATISSRNKINKSEVTKIDGIEGLIYKKGLDNFIKEVVEQSYFFAEEIVEKRNIELSCLKILPARKTQKGENSTTYQQIKINGQWWYKDSTYSSMIELDKDGNARVRQCINKLTGYTICQGAESIFQNYAISHIWGRAFDPRYFTSLWNVVIIPAWANSLMDKIDPVKGSPAERIQATFKSICDKLYSGLKNNLTAIPNVEDSPCKGKYTINVICLKNNNCAKLGGIIKKQL